MNDLIFVMSHLEKDVMLILSLGPNIQREKVRVSQAANVYSIKFC